MPPSALAGGSCPQNRVDELAAGDHPVGAHGEDAEHGLLPGLAHAQLLMAVPCCYRTEHANAQHHGFADLPLLQPTQTLNAAPHPGQKRLA